MAKRKGKRSGRQFGLSNFGEAVRYGDVLQVAAIVNNASRAWLLWTWVGKAHVLYALVIMLHSERAGDLSRLSSCSVVLWTSHMCLCGRIVARGIH